MSILYKSFLPLRTVFLPVFFGLCLWLSALPTITLAQNSIFEVEGVEVDVTADNAIKARDKAFSEAQALAFRTLAQRMLSDYEFSNFTPPGQSVVSTFVKDYEVTKEKLSDIRYIGTYTFRFRADNVKRYFSGSGMQFTDVASKPVLVLPYYQIAGRPVLWSPYNIWMEAWNRTQNLSGLVPVILPLGDIQDVKAVGDEQALNYDPVALSEMIARYSAGEAVLLLAMPDETLANALGGNGPVSGVLKIRIYRTDRARAEFVSEVTQEAKAGYTRDTLFEAAVRQVHQALQKDWKQKTLASVSQTNRLAVKVPIKNLAEWAETRSALERVPGVDEIVIKSVSPKGARADIIFQGSERRLRLALEQADMTLSKPRFSMAGLGQADSALVYELYLNRFATQPQRY